MTVGKEIGITGGGVFPIKQKALRKLRRPSRDRQIRISFGIEYDEYVTDEERQQFEEIKKKYSITKWWFIWKTWTR